MKKRFLAILLALLMLVSILPTAALAATPGADGYTIPYTVTVQTPDLGGKVVTAQYFTTANGEIIHVPERDQELICDGRTYEMASCAGSYNYNNETFEIVEYFHNAHYWLSKSGGDVQPAMSGYSEQANILFSTDDPTVSIDEQWSFIEGNRLGNNRLKFSDKDSSEMPTDEVTNIQIDDTYDSFTFQLKNVGYKTVAIPFTKFADGADIPIAANRIIPGTEDFEYTNFSKSKTFEQLGLPDDIDVQILNYSKTYYYSAAASTVTVSVGNNKITLAGTASGWPATVDAWKNNYVLVAYPDENAPDVTITVSGKAQYNIYKGEKTITKDDIEVPDGFYVNETSSGFSITKPSFVLKGATVESKFDKLYLNIPEEPTEDDVNAIKNDVTTLLTTPANLSVWAYYGLQSVTGFDKDTALKGGYTEDWKNYQLEPTTTIPTETKYEYLLGEYEIVSNDPQLKEDSAAVTFDNDTAPTKATLHIAYYDPFNPGTDKLINSTVEVALVNTSTSHAAKDAAGNKVAGGVASRFDDAAGFKKYLVGEQTAGEETIYDAVRFNKTYANKNYYFGASTGEGDTKEYIADLTNTDNKTYMVHYTPFNDYDEITTSEGKYLLGAPAVFKPYADSTDDPTPEDVDSLKEVAFCDAGLYTVTERVTRHDEDSNTDKTFDRIFYVVIDQADLTITQATDTVNTNTPVQNHRFDRFVEGANDEQVFGTFTYAQTDGGADWGDGDNRAANAKFSFHDYIKWEFNVSDDVVDGSSGDTIVHGKRNQNNYLDQNDGASAANAAKNQNTYYNGYNGVLTWVPNGIIRTRTANMTLDVKTVKQQYENATAKQTEDSQFTTETIRTLDRFPKTVTGVYAEDVKFSGGITTSNLGWRVVKDDAVTALTEGDPETGTQINSKNDLPIGYRDYYENLITEGKYKGDLYIVTVKAGDKIVETITYTDDTAKNTVNNIASTIMGQLPDTLPACEYYGVPAYTVTVDYIGLYYTTETSTNGRKANWNGEEEFNWVTSKLNFALDVEQRNVQLDADALNDLNKIYDGTTYLVKQTKGTGAQAEDVVSASKYIIDLESTNTDTQFGKKPGDILKNYVDPTTDTQNHLAIELAGNYASADKGDDQNVTITAKRLLNFQNIGGKGTSIPAAGNQVAALNYKIVDEVSGTAQGKVDTAALHFTHDLYGKVNVNDFTPMHEALGISAKAYQLTVTDGVNGEKPDGFYDVLTMTKKELVEENDAKTSFASFKVNKDKYDYAVSYEINTGSTYGPKFAGSTLKIDKDTGKVIIPAIMPQGGIDPRNYPAIDVSVKVSPNFVLKADGVHAAAGSREKDIFNTCTIDYEGNCSHTLRFCVVINHTPAISGGNVPETTEDNTMLNFCVDVQKGDYYYDAVLWAYENDICKGIDNVHFGPTVPITRAQVVTFLWRAAGCPEPAGDASKFTDVKAGSYYEKAVAWAIEQGITKGTSDTTFSPDMVCTRGQIVTFLARFAGVKDEDAGYTHGFTDVKATDYFNNAVAWAKDNGVTEGTTATTFSPNADCTRAQVVTFLWRWVVK